MLNPRNSISNSSSLILLSILLCITASCGKVPVVGKIVDNDTLPERISSAEIVLVGKLVTMEERAFVVQESRLNDFGQPYKHYTYYDLGVIQVEEIIKGSFKKGAVYFRFLSFDQTQHPPNDKADCTQFSFYNIWDPGIWLIDIVKNSEPRFSVERGNFVPLNRLEDVRESIEND